MDDYLEPGKYVVKYSDVMADIQDQILAIFFVCGAFLFLYALFNMYIVESKWFEELKGDLPMQVVGFMDAVAVMFSLFVCLCSGIVLFGINI